MSWNDWLLLGAFAAMSMGIRLVGALAGRQLGNAPVIRNCLEAVPGAVLVALVVPDLVGRGPEGIVGAAATLGTMLYARNAVVGMGAGMLVTAIWRAVI
jgi:uncharacterized membrane protein